MPWFALRSNGPWNNAPDNAVMPSGAPCAVSLENRCLAAGALAAPLWLIKRSQPEPKTPFQFGLMVEKAPVSAWPPCSIFSNIGIFHAIYFSSAWRKKRKAPHPGRPMKTNSTAQSIYSLPKRTVHQGIFSFFCKGNPYTDDLTYMKVESPTIPLQALRELKAPVPAASSASVVKKSVVQLAREVLEHGGPGYVQFAITNICNAQCGFCGFAADKMERAHRRSVTLEQARDAHRCPVKKQNRLPSVCRRGAAGP